MKNPWVRKGIFYKAKVSYIWNYQQWSVTYTLDPLAYWLIRWHHGEQVLINMGTKLPKRACERFGHDEIGCVGKVCARPAMTAYSWNGKGENPNRDVILCEGHLEEYVDHWTDMWKNVPRG